MERVIAVVVTFNRQELLSECITALRRQTRKLDSILVINNGSTDNTENWLRQQKDLQFITQKNTGSSGGFNTGINLAYQQGHSWIWCMDDDGYPKEDALEKLLEADDDNLRLLNCAVINKEDKRSFVWKTQQYKTLDEVDVKVIHGIGHPFNGTLLNRRIIERVGVPKTSFFLWGDETEYYYRIVRKNNIPVCTIPSSIHYHPSAAFSIKKDWDHVTAWKMYYYVRNRFHIHNVKFQFKAIAWIHYLCFLAAYAGTILLYQKTDKMKKLSFITWPMADAFSNNFEATPTTILSRLKANNSKGFTHSLSTYFKNIRHAVQAVFSTPGSAANA
jgi:GT2 family glycosyltransferase